MRAVVVVLLGAVVLLNVSAASGDNGAPAPPVLSAPTVVTGAASMVSASQAVVTGSITANGSPTQYWFQYGTTTSYGLQTGTRGAGSGSSAVSVSAHVSNLTPGTTYHFRLVASNSTGTTDGTDQSFTTPASLVPTVVTGAASSVTATSATVGGTVTPNGAHTRYSFQYGTTTSYGLQTGTRDAGSGTSSVTVSAPLFRLTGGTTYHYRLVASNGAGTTDGSDQTFSTPASPLPTAVTGAASSVKATSAAIAGTVTPNGSRTRYWFQYGTSTSYGSQTWSRAAGSGTSAVSVSASLGRLTAGTTYHYRLVASNSVGTADGADQTFTTAAATQPQRHWFAGSVSAVGSSSLTVGVLWTGPHDGSLNGQTLTVGVPTNTRINQGPHGRPIALAQIVPNDLVAIQASGTSAASLTASRIHVYCNCHWIGGTISSLGTGGTSFNVQVSRTGPYDTVLGGHDVTLQVNDDTVYLRGSRRHRIGFGDLQVGDGVGVVFAANGFFKAPGFDPTTATFTAERVHVWNHRQIPLVSSDAGAAAATNVSFVSGG
jgi:hypothetical protein